MHLSLCTRAGPACVRAHQRLHRLRALSKASCWLEFTGWTATFATLWLTDWRARDVHSPRELSFLF